MTVGSVANKLLGSERFTTGHPRNAAVLLNKARQVGRVHRRDPRAGFLQRLAALEIDLLAFSAYYRHAAALHAHGTRAALDGAGDQDRRRRASASARPSCWSTRPARSVRWSTT